MASSTPNPGADMAAAVDTQVALYRELQEDIQKLQTDRQLLMQQQNENEMVKQELALLDDSAQVYKMIGPVLIKNDTDDAKQTVNQRLELILNELKKTDTMLKEKEDKSKEIAEKVRQMQSMMQSAAVEAARLAAQQATSG